MKEVTLSGKRIRLDAAKPLGEGGEAEVFDVRSIVPGPPMALKLWKTPDHPDFQGDDPDKKRNREGARARLRDYGAKLEAFPRGLPDRVVAPVELARDRTGDKVLGYTMRIVEDCERLRELSLKKFRERTGVGNDRVLQVFIDLYETVAAIHRNKVVIGDFNNLNVLVRGAEAYLIDADSLQYGAWHCHSFTGRFVDPLVCDPTKAKLVQYRPHSEDTDWYAFAVMLFESLMYVHPYGGVYAPKNPADDVPLDSRPLHRISVFHKQVIYPSKGTPLSWLPARAQDHFGEIFTKGRDRRGQFPRDLLDLLLAHAQGRHYDPAKAVTPLMKAEIIRGAVSSRRIKLLTGGAIVQAALQNGKLALLVNEGSEFQREDGSTVVRGALDRRYKFRICGARTVVGMGDKIAVLSPGSPQPQLFPVDQYQGRRPVFATNARHVYWLSNGELVRDETVLGAISPKHIGMVLADQTMFWVGPSFGFGFYRAGGLTFGFVFDAEKGGIDDSVKLPQLRGELIDATCVFSSNRAWFFTSLREGDRIVNRCIVIRPDGSVSQQAEGQEDDGTWLGSIRGKYAATLPSKGGGVIHRLFSATEKGLVGIEEQNGTLAQTVQYPDTRDLVDSDAMLLFDARHGLYVVSAREARLLSFAI